MRRGANLAISRWYCDTVVPERWQRAACIDHQTLPWTHDTTPSVPDLRAMAAVCESCPIRSQCADYALRQHAGGFYAGAWLPWHTPNDSDLTKFNRSRARRYLKELLGIRRGRPPKPR